MVAEKAILVLGALILVSCGLGLVFVHSSNPLLKGLHRMGMALAVAGLAASLARVSLDLHALFPIANICMLLALVLCNVADQLLIGKAARVTRLSRALLAIQGLLACLEWSGLIGSDRSVAGTSLLMSAQLYATACLVRSTWRSKQRLPALFTVSLMQLLMGASVVRAGVALGGLLRNVRWGPILDVCTFSVFIAGAVGLGFAFFWRTTTGLTMELEEMASTDPLTKVYNRRTFLRRCEEVYLASKRSGELFSILMLDLDHFKSLNDRFGHHTGDEALCAVVECIQDATRGSDVICRWGGEEFVVLLPKASRGGALIAAERIRSAVQGIRSSDPRFALVEGTFDVSVSVGGSVWQGGVDAPEEMIRRADQYLYQAKRGGRNCVRMEALGQDTPLARAVELDEQVLSVSVVAS